MPHLFWFLVGIATGAALALLAWPLLRPASARSRRSSRSDRVTEPEGVGSDNSSRSRVEDEDAVGNSAVVDELTRRLIEETRRDVETVAHSLGDEIASLASAIEGHAELLREASLAESSAERALVVHRGDHLLGGVRRLRHFSHKILSFAHVDELAVGRAPVADVLDDVIAEIEDWGLHYRIEQHTSEFLPDVIANPHALRNAILFLVETLLSLDSRASRLSISAFAKVYEHQDTRVVLEISAEADETGSRHEASHAAVQLGYVAARNLLEAQGARLSFDEVEGLSVTCYVNLVAAPARSDQETRAKAGSPLPARRRDRVLPAQPPRTRETLPEPPAAGLADENHSFGGVLVLEDDPALREMIAVEFERSGRKLVSCVDGAAARSLIDATPERFELAILEQSARIESGSTIAALLQERCPSARIVLLTTAADSPGADLPESMVELRKPFRLNELRHALRRALAPTVEPS